MSPYSSRVMGGPVRSAGWSRVRQNPVVALTISSYRELFASVRKRPGMWLVRGDFACVVAFVDGCNEGNARTLLDGFQPWLVTRAGCLDNHVWWSIVAHLTKPVGVKKFREMSPELDARVVATLFDLLDEFLELRDEHDGLKRIFAAHEQWVQLRRQNSCVATGKPACPVVPWPRPASRLDEPSPTEQATAADPGGPGRGAVR